MMQKLLKIVFIIAFQFFAFPQTNSTIWYITPTGSGSQTGTDRGNAWSMATMNQNSLQPGDFVYFGQGTYTTALFTTKAGTAGYLITFMADPINTDTVWFQTPTLWVGTAINLNKSYIRLKNIGVRNSQKGILITSSSTPGVMTTNVFVDSCIVINNQYAIGARSGYEPSGGHPDDINLDSVWVRWNYITTSATYHDGSGSGESDAVTGRSIRRYYIIGNYIEVLNNIVSSGHNDCFQVSQGNGEMIVVNNYFKNSKEEHSQISMTSVAIAPYKTVYYNNVGRHYGYGPMLAHNPALLLGFIDTEAGPVYILHNTMVGRGNHHFHLSEPYIMKNNITHTFNPWGSAWVYDPFVLGGNDYDYNIIYSAGSTTAAYATPSGGTRPLQWMYDKGQSANDLVTTDTKFVDVEGQDYRLQGDSPAKNFGTNLQSLIEGWNITDPLGIMPGLLVGWKSFDNPYVSFSNPVPRGSNPSAGAWEFAGGGGGNYPPYPPTNPNPSNGATAQPLNLTMTWTCTDPDGDPLTYDVYFGTSTNPPLVSSNQSNTSFNPGNLNTNTTYYWKIVAKDNQGHSTSGSLWNFATTIVDVTPPEVVSAALLDSVTLRIIFSEPLEQSGAQNTGNYSITNGINIFTASLSGSEVTLTTSIHPVGTYTVTVNNVTDFSGNIISPSANFANYEWTAVPPNLVIIEPIAVRASSTNSNNYPPENTIDGIGYYQDPESRWAATPIIQYLIFDLGSEKQIMQTRFSFFRFYTGRIYIYSVLATNDTNSTWTLVLDQVQSELEEWTTESFPQVSARFIKLLFNGSIPSESWASLFEVEIWGLDSVVPVELTFFNASYSDGKVNLVWSTSSETNCYGFEVQRRSDNSSYTQIGFVNGNGTTINSHTYTYIDQNLTEGKYYYRLKEMASNGDFRYSTEILIDIPDLSSFELQQNYPNPFNPSTNIAIRLPHKTNIKLTVYNMLGELVVDVASGEYDSGTHNFRFDATGLTSGIYYYRLESENFADTKKMILLR